MCRNTPHTTTDVCQSRLLFDRILRTKLHEPFDYKVDVFEVRYRDAERKENDKIYPDKRRRAIEAYIHAGDQVLVKQDREHKLSTPFNASVVQHFKDVEMIEWQ